MKQRFLTILLTNTAVTIESIASRDDLAIQLNISQNGSNYLRNFILFNNLIKNI